jgi:hypothetical protein
LFDRRAGNQLEEERRQRDIDDEGVHPAQRLDGLAGDAGDQGAEKDHPEKGQDKTDNVRHETPSGRSNALALTRPAPARQGATGLKYGGGWSK